MTEDRVPWVIHRLDSMIAPTGVSSLDSSGIWVRAVPEPYFPETLRERLTAAWWVFRGKAHAVRWPKDGDLERALGIYRGPKS